MALAEPRENNTIIDLASIDERILRVRAGFTSRRTQPLHFRKKQLQALDRLLVKGEDELLDALSADLGKHRTEGWLTEIAIVRAEIKEALSSLKSWAAPKKVRLPAAHQPGKAEIRSEPLGVVLVIAPWNYPLQLLFSPIVAAIAAGNCVVAKPSELAPATSAAIAHLVPQFLDGSVVTVVEGGVEETTELLRNRFDHIFFTGGPNVARVVMEAAAAHLTPVTLELGGKSPAIVTRDANVAIAARRVAWGKWLNAGQTCVAPDYVLVHPSVQTEFIDALSDAVQEFFGVDAATSESYGRIVNARHQRRLERMLRDPEAGRVAFGGSVDAQKLFIEPTVLVNPDLGATVMNEEIFGPILPVVPCADLDAAIAFVNGRPQPLALYVFTESSETAERILDQTSSGGACINHCVQQVGITQLPFGGVGESGTGAYHGQAGFDRLSHKRSVLNKPTRPDLRIAYPPYTAFKDRLYRKLL